MKRRIELPLITALMLLVTAYVFGVSSSPTQSALFIWWMPVLLAYLAGRYAAGPTAR